jgi:hypothetical protein
LRRSRGPRRGRKDGSEVSCGSDLTHLSPRDARVPAVWWGDGRSALVFRRGVLVERPALTTGAHFRPAVGRTRFCAREGTSERPGSRRSWRRDGWPLPLPGAAVLVACSTLVGPGRRPSGRPLSPRGAARPSGPADPSLTGPGPPNWRPAERPARAVRPRKRQRASPNSFLTSLAVSFR